MGSAIEDIEFLARSAYRADALRRLLEGPADRDALRDATGASKPTIARLLKALEARRWVERRGHDYALTDPGRVVAEAFTGLVDTVAAERSLREVWDYLPSDLPGFSLELFEDAVVRFTETGSPYRPIPRTMELIESTRAMRLFSQRIPKAETLEGIVRSAIAGAETELVFPPDVVKEVLASVSGSAIREAAGAGTLAILELEGFPTDTTVVVYDDRVGLYCRDELGVTRLSIDTDAPEAVRWGESVYEDVRAGARPVDLVERAT